MAKILDLAGLDDLIEEITVDAYGDDEMLWAFRQAMEDEIHFPCDGSIIGESVSVTEIDYDGNERRGLTALCRRKDGSKHVVAAADIVLPKRSKAYRYFACYRRWLGLDPFPQESVAPPAEPRRKKKDIDLNLKESTELAVLSVKQMSARCRIMKGDLEVTFRTGYARDLIPGEIVTVKPGKMWNYAGHSYISGEIESARLDIAALNLIPLNLHSFGLWDPNEHYWGEEGEPIEKWAKPIIARGVRPSFEMEQVIPGVAPDDFDSDPICEAVDLNNVGDHDAAYKILMDLCQQELRCLDAHAHLGNFNFDHAPEQALRHYDVGCRIGELSLGPGFDGVLEWGLIGNRPFLRCMQGYGLCLWRLGRFKEAEKVFEKMLWLNPSDNQGVRFVIQHVRAKEAWHADW